MRDVGERGEKVVDVDEGDVEIDCVVGGDLCGWEFVDECFVWEGGGVVYVYD